MEYLHFGSAAEHDGFLEKVNSIAKEFGLSQITFYSKGKLNASKNPGFDRAGRQDRNVQETGSGAGDTGSASRPSDLFKGAIDHLLVPYAKVVAGEYRGSLCAYIG